MNTIQDILSLANTLSKDASLSNLTKTITPRAQIRSISSYAGNAIYYFPVLCSNTVSPDTAGMVMSTLERVYCGFIKATFTLMPAMKVTGDSLNVEDYLKQFHQNIGVDSSYRSIKLHENACRAWEIFPNEILNESSLDDFTSKAKELNEKYQDTVTHGDGTIVQTDEKTNDHKALNITNAKHYDDKSYKKESSMECSYVVVDVTFLIGQTEKPISVTLPVGVKTQLHSLDSDRLCDRIVDSMIGKGVVHDLIRWSTGEMLSLKDILLGVSKIKDHVSRDNDEVDKWVNTLQSRKRLADASLPAINKKAFLPNTTIIITMSDAKAIERQYGIDVLDPKYARRLISDNFLLAFVIVDDMTDSLNVMYDGHSHFEEYPYSTLHRENAKNDKEMKTLIQTIGKMR